MSKMKERNTRSSLRYVVVPLCLLMLLASLATGCRDDERDEGWPGAATQGESLETWAPEAIRISPRSEVQLSEREEALLRELTARRSEILAAQPPPHVLAEMELVFLMDGQLPQLADYYQEALGAQGSGSYLTPRLAWVYMQLGLGDRALELAEQGVAERPEDPFAHFAHGYALSSQPGVGEEEQREVYEAFATMLELDPDFAVAGFVGNEVIRQQVRRLGDELDQGQGSAESSDIEGSGAQEGSGEPATGTPEEDVEQGEPAPAGQEESGEDE